MISHSQHGSSMGKECTSYFRNECDIVENELSPIGPFQVEHQQHTAKIYRGGQLATSAFSNGVNGACLIEATYPVDHNNNNSYLLTLTPQELLKDSEEAIRRMLEPIQKFTDINNFNAFKSFSEALSPALTRGYRELWMNQCRWGISVGAVIIPPRYPKYAHIFRIGLIQAALDVQEHNEIQELGLYGEDAFFHPHYFDPEQESTGHYEIVRTADLKRVRFDSVSKVSVGCGNLYCNDSIK
ncbi:MAG: hypothetical protein M3Q80_02700 [bacterium]|nr:hypothetical protein [bacterium]